MTPTVIICPLHVETESVSKLDWTHDLVRFCKTKYKTQTPMIWIDGWKQFSNRNKRRFIAKYLQDTIPSHIPVWITTEYLEDIPRTFHTDAVICVATIGTRYANLNNPSNKLLKLLERWHIPLRSLFRFNKMTRIIWYDNYYRNVLIWSATVVHSRCLFDMFDNNVEMN